MIWLAGVFGSLAETNELEYGTVYIIYVQTITITIFVWMVWSSKKYSSSKEATKNIK